MTTTNPTIIDLKTTFLRTQIHILSTPLRPSQTFTNTNASDDDEVAPLPEKTLDDVLERVNKLLKKHNKLVYGPQATRHVAEQVDRLYWDEAEGAVVNGGRNERWRERGGDLREDTLIEQLPTEYPSAATVQNAPGVAARYENAVARLKELGEKGREARQKVETYRRMRGLVGTFGEDGGVQENLVTRNSAVEGELERMRMLMLRVERGLEGLKDREGGNEDMDWEVEREGQVNAILRNT